MKKTRILVVAPYAGLRELILSMAGQYEQYAFDVIEANLEEAIPRLRQLDLDTYDVILSRGGTAGLIAQVTNQFVVNLGISGYDVLRLIMLARNYPGRAVIVGFDSITRRCRAVCELLQVDVDIHTIESEEQVRQTLNRLDASGGVIVLGDVISTKIAAHMGFTNLLISSGVESVQDAMEEIEQQTRFIRSFQRRLSLHRSLLENAPDASYVFDRDAHPLPEWDDGSALCTALGRHAATVFERETHNFLLTVEGRRQYRVRGRILRDKALGEDVYAALYAREVSPPPGDCAFTLLSPDDIDKSDFNILTGDSEPVKQAVTVARELAGGDAPILIEGEVGTGKSLLAKMIHAQSDCADRAFVEISCALLSPGGLAAILDDDLADVLCGGRSTLFFRGVNRLRISEQEELARRLPTLRRHRLLLSSEQSLFELARTGQFLGELLTHRTISKIWLPPLRECKEDIEGYFYHLLTKINMRYGKQIVGIEKPAVALLQAYGWAGNFEQFSQVVSDAVRQERGSYIRKSVIASLLSMYNQAQWTRRRYSGRTLHELEQEIVIATLQETGMNQSQAAKQLGISRTTLWRLLKSTAEGAAEASVEKADTPGTKTE